MTEIAKADKMAQKTKTAKMAKKTKMAKMVKKARLSKIAKWPNSQSAKIAKNVTIDTIAKIAGKP